MTVAVFLHPLDAAHQVFICQGEWLSPALHLKLITLARKAGHQILLTGPQLPDVQRSHHPVPAFTPQALRADMVSAPGIQHALAHLRAVNRTVFVLHARDAVISEYARHLQRPGRPDTSGRVTARSA